MNKLYLDQFGNKFIAATREELSKQIPGRVSPMYHDKKDGSTVRVGYVIGEHWLTEFVPNEIPESTGPIKVGHVELKMELGKVRGRTRSERYRRALKQAEDLIDAARAAQHALEEMDLVIADFMPNVGRCALQNYQRLNEAPIKAQDAVSKLRALLGPTG